MKPRQFVGYAQRRLDRTLSDVELAAVERARAESDGKRAGVKAMRAALERLLVRPL
jgi:hypothetical protein